MRELPFTGARRCEVDFGAFSHLRVGDIVRPCEKFLKSVSHDYLVGLGCDGNERCVEPGCLMIITRIWSQNAGGWGEYGHIDVLHCGEIVSFWVGRAPEVSFFDRVNL